MKKLILFLALLLMASPALLSQTAVKYTYDLAGNRITRGTQTVSNAPQWIPTGSTRCVTNGSGQNTGYQQRQEKDNNTSSPTYNQLRWVNIGYNISACPLPSMMMATGEYRCQVAASGDNTGYVEEEQVDNNPESPTYNQKKWVASDYLPSGCPISSLCNSSACQANGPEYRCVYGNCEIGYKIFTGSWQEGALYNSTYHYEWSDGSSSSDYYEQSAQPPIGF